MRDFKHISRKKRLFTCGLFTQRKKPVGNSFKTVKCLKKSAEASLRLPVFHFCWRIRLFILTSQNNSQCRESRTSSQSLPVLLIETSLQLAVSPAEFQVGENDQAPLAGGGMVYYGRDQQVQNRVKKVMEEYMVSWRFVATSRKRVEPRLPDILRCSGRAGNPVLIFTRWRRF
jgi:hypothetical protein